MGFRGPQVQILSPRPIAHLSRVDDFGNIKRENPQRQLAYIRRWWAEHQELANRPQLTLSDWLSRSESERNAILQVGIAAVRSVKNLNDVRRRIDNLGQKRYEAAVPTFIDLWRRC